MNIQHPMRRTPNAERVLRARLSLRESQVIFAKRFRVSNITVHKWETGKTPYMQKIYQEILGALIERLQAEGRYLPTEVYENALAASQAPKTGIPQNNASLVC